MRSALLALMALIWMPPLLAQEFPVPSRESPRIQEVEWKEGRSVALTVLPESHLTILLEPGQVIQRATISDGEDWDVSISLDQDGLTLLPARGARAANLSVETLDRRYQFTLDTAQSLLAAYMVRFVSPAEPEQKAEQVTLDPTAPQFGYKLRGNRSVRPAQISDDGRITIIDYTPGQSLPAVFAIGPSGQEEVVDGYMRGGRFVIDRVHQELVFRIDKKKATAKRSKKAQKLP